MLPHLIMMAAGGGRGYQIEGSGYFDPAGPAYLSRYFTTSGDRQKYSRAVWAKLDQRCGGPIMYCNAGGTYGESWHYNGASGQWAWSPEEATGTPLVQLKPRALLRDFSAWLFLAVCVDTTQPIESERAKLYVNLERVTDLETAGYPNLNALMEWLDAPCTAYIGRNSRNTNDKFAGRIAMALNVDGAQLAPELLGAELDENGACRPADPLRTVSDWGSAGFLLMGEGVATGVDSSGNGNDWTPVSVAASADSPTNNLPTINAIWQGSGAVTEGGTRFSDNASNRSFAPLTLAVPDAGKWWLGELSSIDGGTVFGLYDLDAINVSSNPNSYIAGVSVTSANAAASGASVIGAPSWSAAATIGLYVDMDAGTLGAVIDGVDKGAVVDLGASVARWGVLLGDGNNGVASDFVWSLDETNAPAGYLPLSLANYPAPAVNRPAEHFVAVLDTEADIEATLAAARSDWPAWVDILKNRDSTESWAFRFSHDPTNEYAAGSSGASHQVLRSMSGGSDWLGYSLRVDSEAGIRAGSVAHTSGAETVVSLSLPSARALVLLFPRGGGDVYAHHPELTAGKLVRLTSTAAEVTSERINSVSAAGFTIDAGASSGSYDYLVIPEAPGFCALGAHSGNGSSNGPFSWADLKALSLWVKRIDTSGPWEIHDAVRTPDNPSDAFLTLDSADEVTGSSNNVVDLLANGFKVRGAASALNASGGRYISIALAERPFGGAGVSPATAR